MKSFLLHILTPFGKYYDGYVQEIVVATEGFVLVILPGIPLMLK